MTITLAWVALPVITAIEAVTGDALDADAEGISASGHKAGCQIAEPSVDRAATLSAESQVDAITIARSAAHFDGATTRLDNACPPDTHPLGLIERSVFRAAATNVTPLDIAAAFVTVIIARIATLAHAELWAVSADAELQVLCRGGASN